MKLFITFFVLVFCLSAEAQKPTYEEIKKAAGFQNPDTVATKVTITDTLAQNEKAEYDPWEIEKFNFALEQNKKVYAWQNLSSVIIFFVVILIVLTGLYLSYRQFILAEKMLVARKEVQTVEKGGNTVEIMNASLELGKDGVKINTAVIGLVILVISLSFLFLYLKYVYPISIVKS